MKKKKKKIFIPLIIISVLLVFTVLFQLTKFPVSSNTLFSSYTSSSQNLIAHRGFSSVYPENSIPAIEGAIEKGFYGCEFDIHTTKDGKWILNHDSDIDKMTNGTGNISDLNYNEILEFSVDNGNGIENYTDLKLPLLEDALKIISKSQIVPFIEIKGYDPVSFSNLLEIIDQFNLTEKAVIISFDIEALLGIREKNNQIQLMYLTNNLTKEDVDLCIKNGNIGVDINFGNILKMTDALKYAQQNNLAIAAWTIDIPIAADIMNMFGIRNITTNRIYP